MAKLPGNEKRSTPSPETDDFSFKPLIAVLGIMAVGGILLYFKSGSVLPGYYLKTKVFLPKIRDYLIRESAKRERDSGLPQNAKIIGQWSNAEKRGSQTLKEALATHSPNHSFTVLETFYFYQFDFGNYRASLKAAQKMNELFPEEGEGLAYSAWVHFKEKKWDRALECALAARDIETWVYGLNELIGDCYLEMKKPEKGLEYFQWEAIFYPNNPRNFLKFQELTKKLAPTPPMKTGSK